MNVAAVLKTKGRAVATARPHTTLMEITKKLAARKIGTIVIIGDEGKVAGIVSERDVVGAIAKGDEAVLREPVSTIMTSNVITCQEINTVDDMMDVMTKGRFRHVPVIEDDALVGIISIGDVVKHHIAEVEMEVSAMRYYLNG